MTGTCLLAPPCEPPLCTLTPLRGPSCHLKVMLTRMTAELLLPRGLEALPVLQCVLPGNAMGGVPQEKAEYWERWPRQAESFSL